MSMSRRMLAVLALLSFTATAASAQTRDVAGGRDYPGIGRFAGSVITGYVMKDFDAARMQAAAFRPTLEQIAKLLSSQPQLNVFIVGHTDSQGAYEYNLDLSKRRADAVAVELVKSFRIAPLRLRTAGVGLLAPVGSNTSDAGRALNRRVELVAP